MPIYRIADMLFDITPRYRLLASILTPYTAAGEADFTIRYTDEELRAAQERSPENSIAYAESLAVCRAVSEFAVQRGVMLFHAATVAVDGKAYAFSAPSGTGKSTHISLWHQYFGDRVEIINGDKPLLREKDGAFTVYGTPWCGKEGWSRNVSAPLAAICFIARSEENRIRKLSAEETVGRLFGQLLKPKDNGEVAEVLRMTDLLVRNVPVYLLECNISEEAARLSFRTLTGLDA